MWKLNGLGLGFYGAKVFKCLRRQFPNTLTSEHFQNKKGAGKSNPFRHKLRFKTVWQKTD